MRFLIGNYENCKNFFKIEAREKKILSNFLGQFYNFLSNVQNDYERIEVFANVIH